MKTVIVTMLILLSVIALHQTSRILIPVAFVQSDTRIEQCLAHVGVPNKEIKDIARGVRLASLHHKLSPEFMIALAQTESNFKKYAISSKQYKGYTQIPYALYEPSENFLIGARIMREKLAMTNGNVRQAICLYKGYGRIDHPRGLEQADRVLKIYKEIQTL
jgi:hypothetical protein